jgi:sigma-B regulation protein RsbU (phosphoserine phosphatase)
MARGEDLVADVVGRMNQELARNNENMMFVTAAVGCLDLSSGALEIVDAGHNPILLADPGGALIPPPVPKGIALGVIEAAAYAAARLTLAPGATLVLYTDGLTDARSTSGEMFGEDRLHGAIAGAVTGTPASLVAAVIGAVERFAAGAPPEDDITLLALRYAGP